MLNNITQKDNATPCIGTYTFMWRAKKSLKIPKGQSEYVNLYWCTSSHGPCTVVVTGDVGLLDFTAYAIYVNQN